MRWKILLLLLLGFQYCQAQDKATILGKVVQKVDGKPIQGVSVVLKGTTYGAFTDPSGKFMLFVKPGTYNLEVSIIGYEKLLYTNITLKAGEKRDFQVQIEKSAVTIDQNFRIIGEKPLVDIDQTKTETKVDRSTIEAAPTRQVQGILNTQAGVVLNPEGISIRGGRTYETAFLIDGVNASDPMAGTGFGIDLGSNSIDEINVTTGGGDVSVGDGTSGIVKTKTRSGGDKFEASAGVRRDNIGINQHWNSVWNNSSFEYSMGGPLSKNKKLRFFHTFKSSFDDQFYRTPAKQVISSLYPTNLFLSPTQDNRWATMFKIDYALSSKTKISFNYLKSITINQDENMLRIFGNSTAFSPGYQYKFSLQPDNGNTYTHDTNLESFNITHTPNSKISYNFTASRLFVKLRADANGRPWRPQNVDTELDPRVIVDFPTNLFNPNDSVVFVMPGPGLYNNNGIATLWHDHYLEEYAGKFTGNYYYGKSGNRLTFGTEYKHQEMQWIDISRPWIGAPIQLPNGTYTQSFRLGDYSDVWKVSPARGSFFASNKVKFKGLVAEIGARLEYWFPGKFVDQAVAASNTPIRDEVRKAYWEQTTNVFGQQMKMRLLPKISASFPVKDNQMLFFNYNHSMNLPHPSYLYAGLNPLYQDRSIVSKVGNPNLNPEYDISYELGLRTQIDKNDALGVSAYWKDKYDFITSASIQIKDATGREVARTININSDYARVRGIELTYTKKSGKWFYGQASMSYMVARGQSSSANEALKDILNNGNRENTKERPMAWDSPLDCKAFATFTLDKKEGLFGVKQLNKCQLYIEGIYRTGRRYTPYVFIGNDPITGRPLYDVDPNPDAVYSKIGQSNFWVDMNFKRWWNIKNGMKVEAVIQLTNVFNRLNTVIPNPVTGVAYKYGDPVPMSWRDPLYEDPRSGTSYGTPPFDPSRYRAPRHIMFGINLKF
jgi:outer membrane receptor protein involved in Fe transport